MEKLNNPVQAEFAHLTRASVIKIEVVDNTGQRMDVSFSKVIEANPPKQLERGEIEDLLKYLSHNGWKVNGMDRY